MGRGILQFTAGDAAATRALRRSPRTTRVARPPAVPAHFTVQRDPSALDLTPRDNPFAIDALGNQSLAQQPAPAPLSKDERNELIRFTGNRIRDAAHYFALAVEQNRAAVKAAASDSSGFLDLVLEIALGVLLPAVSKGIAHLAEELPAGASNFRYKVALQAMREEQTTKLLETGVKVGKEFLKGEAVVLAGEDEMDAFLNSLEDKSRQAADKIDHGLPELSDEALVVMEVAYAPTVASLEQFRAAVQDLVTKYQKQVKPIGTTEYHWMNKESNLSLYFVVAPDGSKRLALLENDELKEWISPELRETAIARFKSMPVGHVYGGKVPEIPAAHVDNLSG